MIEAKNLLKICFKIHKHLNNIEREYRRKNIEHRIREDWGYAFYNGKLVAYIYILNQMMILKSLPNDFKRRLIGLGLK